jgi:hypothetical protein
MYVRVMSRQDVYSAVEKTISCESYLFAAFRLEDGKIHLDRVTNGFPADQFRAAITLLEDNLNEELAKNGLMIKPED